MKTLLLFAALFLGGAGTVQAGGWVVVTLDSLLDGVTVGEEQTVGFMLLQHGTRPAPGSEADVSLVHRETGERVSVRATDEGPLGHYVARFTLSKAGWWDWKIRTWGRDYVMPPVLVQTAVPALRGADRAGAMVYYGPTPFPSEPELPWPVVVALGLLLASLRVLRKRDGVTTGMPSNSRSARRARSLVTTQSAPLATAASKTRLSPGEMLGRLSVDGGFTNSA